MKQYCQLKLSPFSTYLEILERRIFQNYLSCSRAARPCGTSIQRSFLIQQGFFPWAGYRNIDLSQNHSLFSNNRSCKRVRKSLPIQSCCKVTSSPTLSSLDAKIRIYQSRLILVVVKIPPIRAQGSVTDPNVWIKERFSTIKMGFLSSREPPCGSSARRKI